MLLGSTVVLRRKFDPEDCLCDHEAERCDSLVVIPVMLQRIMELSEETLPATTTSRGVKVVAASGSALPGDLATDWMDHFGDNLYNIYGSTEVAWASIATPATCARRRRRRASRRGRPWSRSTTRTASEVEAGGVRAGSSSATPCSSRATPAAATRT